MEPIVNKKYKNDLYVTHETMDNAIGYAIRACKTLQDPGDKAMMIVAIQGMMNTVIAEEEKREPESTGYEGCKDFQVSSPTCEHVGKDGWCGLLGANCTEEQ